MFNLLKDKLKSWLGKTEEPKKKTKSKLVKALKGKKKEPKLTKGKTKTKKEIILNVPKAISSDKIQKEEVEEPTLDTKEVSTPIEPEVNEDKKKSFFGKLFGKKEEKETIKENTKEIKEEDSQKTIKEAIEVSSEEKPKASIFTRFFSGKSTIKDSDVNNIFDELEIILLESNIALEVVDSIKETIRTELIGKEIKKESIEELVIESIKKAVNEVLLNPPDLISEIKNHSGTYTIVFFGINGSGKTTSIAKLAYKLKKAGITCAVAAADTFRAAAVEQLELHAKKIGIPIVKSNYGTDPTSVAFDAKKYAENHKIKCLLIDTAGRMYTKENLIKQMEKLIRVIQPNKKIFVGESTTGNDAIEQVKTFNEAIGIDGIILSKADVDEKGGTALSVSHITKKPIYFLGTGQTYDDLEQFDKEKILKSIGLD